jgi:hypothetical protein
MRANLAVFAWFAPVVALVIALTPARARPVAGSLIAARRLLGMHAGLAPTPQPAAAGRLWGIRIAAFDMFSVRLFAMVGRRGQRWRWGSSASGLS